MLSIFLASSNQSTGISCDKTAELLFEFNNCKKSLGLETHVKVSTIKEFVKYWLYGTANEQNWFDKGCQDGWDSLKRICSTTTTNEQNWFDKGCQAGWDSLKGMCSNSSVVNNNDGSKQLLVTTNNQPNYLVSGLTYLLTGCVVYAAVYYNCDALVTIYNSIDNHLYNILCMFDFPGFMVEKKSVMQLIPGLNLRVNHYWNFTTDPGDNKLGLVHLATYTIDHQSFFLDFNCLSPAWSIPSYAQLTLEPGLDWPFNYDNFHHINLFSFV